MQKQFRGRLNIRFFETDQNQKAAATEQQGSASSSSMASSSCRQLPVALPPFPTCASSSSLHLSPPRSRRCRRVLYPAGQRRRAPLKEAPDQARRWLLLLSALVLLQIYNEETQTCTELQTQSPDLVCQLQEEDGSLVAAQHQRRDEAFRLHTASDGQPECVVA